MLVEEAFKKPPKAISPVLFKFIAPAFDPDTSTSPPKDKKSPSTLMLPPSFAVKFPATTMSLPLPRVMTPFCCEAVVATRLPGMLTAR